jgi:hypothetical protein
MSSTIQSITSAIPSLGRARLLISSADDVVIVSAVRTPVTRVSQHPFTVPLFLSWISGASPISSSMSRPGARPHSPRSSLDLGWHWRIGQEGWIQRLCTRRPTRRSIQRDPSQVQSRPSKDWVSYLFCFLHFHLSSSSVIHIECHMVER